MKIAFFHNLPTGGAKRVLFEEIKYFSKNHNVSLFQIGDGSKDFLDFSSLPCQICTYTFPLNNKLPSILNRLLSDYSKFFKLKNLHQKIANDINGAKFDYIIVHADKYTQAPYILRFLQTPTLYYCNEWLRIVYEDIFSFSEQVHIGKKLYEEITRYIRKNIDISNIKKSKSVVANSHFTKGNIKHAYNIDAKVCYPGVDARVFENKKIDRKKQILFVGEKSRANGYDILVQSLKLLEKKYCLEIKIVDFTKDDVVSDEKLSFLYSESLATICLSRNEPFGLVALESMACETPVIAVDEGGYKETVKNGISGFLILRDPKELVRAILKLLKSKELVEKIGKNARKHVQNNLTWEKHNKCLENIINKT